ncbi:MAG: Uncharacterized nucleoside diphosphate sugar transferase SCO3743, partial [uncultured Nocardioidaceae bacterium]
GGPGAGRGQGTGPGPGEDKTRARPRDGPGRTAGRRLAAGHGPRVPRRLRRRPLSPGPRRRPDPGGGRSRAARPPGRLDRLPAARHRTGRAAGARPPRDRLPRCGSGAADRHGHPPGHARAALRRGARPRAQRRRAGHGPGRRVVGPRDARQHPCRPRGRGAGVHADHGRGDPTGARARRARRRGHHPASRRGHRRGRRGRGCARPGRGLRAHVVPAAAVL